MGVLARDGDVGARLAKSGDALTIALAARDRWPAALADAIRCTKQPVAPVLQALFDKAPEDKLRAAASEPQHPVPTRRRQPVSRCRAVENRWRCEEFVF